MSFLKKLKRACTDPSLWKELFAVASDYRQFADHHPYLPVVAPENGQKVLYIGLNNHIAYAKMGGIFLASLALRGYKPVVLTYTHFKRSQAYYRLFGVTEFIYLDTLMKEQEDQKDEEIIQKFFSSDIQFHDLMHYTYENVEVGKHVLSTAVRRLRHGSLTFGDSEVDEMLKLIMKKSLVAARAANALFKDFSPALVLFEEKGYSPNGEICDAAISAGLNTVQHVPSQRSDAYSFKRFTTNNKRSHPYSLSLKTWEKAKNMNWDTAEEQEFMEQLEKSYTDGSWFNRKHLLKDKVLKTEQEVRDQLQLDLTKKTAVIFSHVLWDATFFFGESLFEDYEKWLIETVKAACSNKNVNWIIKLHPDYIWKMRDMKDKEPRDILALDSNIGELPDHVQVVRPDTDISTYSFFAVTDYCITVRGTIGIECPCFGIPVITAGTGRYSGFGITNESSTKEEYLQKIRTIETIPTLTQEQTRLGRLHAYTLFIHRPKQIESFAFLVERDESKMGRGLDHNVELYTENLEEFRTAKDLEIICDWLMNSTDEDLIDF